jgi:hypothetical protein
MLVLWNLTNSEFAIIRTAVLFAHYDLDDYIVAISKKSTKEEHKQKKSLFFKHGLSNAKYVGYQKCF